MKKLDAIIIGVGQAGPSHAGRLTAAGMTVALAERNRFGGTCVNTGCTPTKTLIASARAAYVARRAAESAEYGVVRVRRRGRGRSERRYIAREGALTPSLPSRERASSRGSPAWSAARSAADTRALDGDHRKVSDRIVAYALYTDPPLGRGAFRTIPPSPS
jgi:choline dehydrogenase-like flavoprotein